MSAIPKRLGRYELLKPLGRGSIGEVWEAHDLQLRRNIAIKMFHPDLQADPHFLHRVLEARSALVSLLHTNIVQIHDVQVTRPSQTNEMTAYMVMEYVTGTSLTTYLQATSHQQKFPALSQILALFSSLAIGLDYAHQKGVIHGTLKPGNILLNAQDRSQFEGGEPLLVDFGLPQLLNSSTIASPYYIAPEQARGFSPVSRSDIYSLGVILYEICTGQLPFRGDSAATVLQQQIGVAPPSPSLVNPYVPAALSEVILFALSKDATTRFATASLFAIALAEACSLRPIISIPHTHQFDSQSSVNHHSILGVPSRPPLRTRNLQPLPQPLPTNDFEKALYNYQQQQAPSQQPTSFIEAQQEPAPPSIALQPTSVFPPLPSTSFPPEQPQAIETVESSPYLAAEEAQEEIPTDIELFPQERITTNFADVMSTPSVQNTFSADYLFTPETPEQVMPIAPPTPLQQSPVYQPMLAAPVAPSLPYRQPPPPSRTAKRATPAYIFVGLVILVVLVIGGSIGGIYFFTRPTPGGTTNPSNGPIAQVFIQDDALGHASQLRIELQGIKAPASGQQYAAWLQKTDQQFIFLGMISLQPNGNASYTYQGDEQHTNLLSYTQGVIITSEQMGPAPKQPSQQIIYRGSYNNTLSQQLRSLLYVTPDFPGNQSVIIGLFDAIKSIDDKANSIAENLSGTTGYDLVHRQAIRIVEILNSTDYALSNGALPAGTKTEINTPVSILSGTGKPSYLDSLNKQMKTMKSQAQGNQNLLDHIEHVENATTNLNGWLQSINDYSVQLVKATDLKGPQYLDIALQIKQLAAYAHSGRTIPPNQGPLPTLGSAGIIQAYVESQYMASLVLEKV